MFLVLIFYIAEWGERMAAVQPWHIGKACGFARPENHEAVFRRYAYSLYYFIFIISIFSESLKNFQNIRKYAKPLATCQTRD